MLMQYIFELIKSKSVTYSTVMHISYDIRILYKNITPFNLLSLVQDKDLRDRFAGLFLQF